MGTNAENQVEREFDSFYLSYCSLDLDDSTNPGTKSLAYITCLAKNQLVGNIVFYDRQPPPINSYRGSPPNYNLRINFHISRFNDIINILRYHRPLSLSFDLVRLDGAVNSGGLA
jgi:hypothetical protein